MAWPHRRFDQAWPDRRRPRPTAVLLSYNAEPFRHSGAKPSPCAEAGRRPAQLPQVARRSALPV